MVSFTAGMNIKTLVEQDTTLSREARSSGGRGIEYAGPCPFCGGTDRFRVWPDHPDSDGGEWWCRVCDRGGDVIAYRVERGEITPKEAGRLRNDNGDNRRRSTRGKPKERLKPPTKLSTEAPVTAWREQAARFADYCAEQIWESDNAGLAHLRDRGLTDDTIRAWGLGWHGKSRRRPAKKWGLSDDKAIYLARGITIPWRVDGDVWHVKARVFEDWGPDRDTPKYIRVKGGEPSLYGLDRMESQHTVVICEGELDAALLWQEAGDLVDVVAVGTKTQRLNPRALARLTGAARWFLALDNDADDKAGEWQEWSSRVRRIRPLEGNDITDFHQAGGDLRAWITFHLERDNRQRIDRLEAEARALIEAELQTPEAVRRYAEIADTLDYPCSGTPWPEWAAEVINDSRI